MSRACVPTILELTEIASVGLMLTLAKQTEGAWPLRVERHGFSPRGTSWLHVTRADGSALSARETARVERVMVRR